MTPLADFDELAEPEEVEFTERLQPVTDVPIAVLEESSVKSKFAFLMRPSSVFVSSVDSEEEDEDEEESSPPSAQDAKIAPADDTIMTDKRKARNLLLRLLLVVFM